MGQLAKRVLSLVVLILSVLVYRNGRSVKNVILFKSALPELYSPGQCSVIKHEGMKFCEDETFWEVDDKRMVLLTCDPNRLEWNTVMGPLNDPDPLGSLWLYSGVGARRITLENYPAGHDFHPLGLDIWPSVNGAPSNLFVVNHARERTVIEQFTLSPDSPTTARHIRTISSSHFKSANALALTSPTSFYVSNDHFFTRRLPFPLAPALPMLETLLGLPFSWVSHVSLTVDPATVQMQLNSTYAARGLAFANGISLHPAGSHLAVASSTAAVVHIYDRDPVSNKLTYSHDVPLPFAVDNIGYAEDGSIVAAGHPHFPSLIGVSKKTPGLKAQSWVVSLTPRAVEPEVIGIKSPLATVFDGAAPISASTKVPPVASHEINTLFQSDGSFFSSSSTGLKDVKTGTVYIIGLYEEGLLMCEQTT